MRKALEVANGTFLDHPYGPNWKVPSYSISPSLDEVEGFYRYVRDNRNLPLYYDIETEDTAAADEDERDELVSKDIIQVQLGAGGKYLALKNSPEFWNIIDKTFALDNIKANHNCWNYDNPILKSKGVKFGNGKIHDTMWMFKHWHPKLPRGLQSVASLFRFPFPWKHLFGSNLPWYGCADIHAVEWIINILPKLMKARGVWEGYMRHVVDLNVVMTRATEHGMPVDIKKHEEVKKVLEGKRKEVDKEIQKVIPDEIRNIKPKRKDKSTGEVDYGYIREPPIVRHEFDTYERLSKALRDTGKSVVSFEEFLYRKHNLAYCEFERVDNGVRERLHRWAKVEPFKASKDQLVKYLRWKQKQVSDEAAVLRDERQRLYNGVNPEMTARIHELEELAKDYEVPLDLKSKKETTNKKELEEMFFNTGDPILEKVVQIRSLDTNLNNYLPNWTPGKDGRVHPKYGYTAPSGQINSWNPNSQNISKHTDFGNEFRGIIVAPPGYCFVEADKKSFHVATLGYCANDKDYIRFSQIDPHSILGSYIDPSVIGQSISLKWSNADIKEAAKEFKKRCKQHKAKDPQHNIDVRQELAKPTVLGNQLELGAKKLQRQNRRFIHYVTEKEKSYFKGEGYSAEGLQNIVANLFDKPVKYKAQIKELAHIQRFLINEFQRIQYFYNVFSFFFNKKMGKWDRRDGEEARLPIAFRVQSTAFGMITEEILTLEKMGVCEEHNFIVTIHDSLVFMPEIGKRDKLIETIKDVMNRPCRQLVNDATGPEGLRVGVEISVGRNQKAYDEETNPEGMQEI
jgi:DNA polymerase I-like protein with 3'-5' exonuclease and polymerase domains